MTISPWLIYFADLADNIEILSTILMVVSAITFFIFNDELNDKGKLVCCILFLISGVLLTFTPSTKTIYRMMIVPPIVNSNVAQKLPDELQQYIDKVLKDKDSK